MEDKQMPISMGEFVKTVDQTYDEHKPIIKDALNKALKEIAINLRDKGVILEEKQGAGFSPSWEWVMVLDRIKHNVSYTSILDLSFEALFSPEELISK